jgi:hypothetical protein
MADKKLMRVYPMAHLGQKLRAIADQTTGVATILRFLHVNSYIPEDTALDHCLIYYSEYDRDFSETNYRVVIEGKSHSMSNMRTTLRQEGDRDLADMLGNYLGNKPDMGYTYEAPYTILVSAGLVRTVNAALSSYNILDVEMHKRSR